MDVITEDINADNPWAMLFADDLTLCNTDRERLERRLEIWCEKMEAAGLKMSQKKDRVFASSWRPREHQEAKVLESRSSKPA